MAVKVAEIKELKEKVAKFTQELSEKEKSAAEERTRREEERTGLQAQLKKVSVQ